MKKIILSLLITFLLINISCGPSEDDIRERAKREMEVGMPDYQERHFYEKYLSLSYKWQSNLFSKDEIALTVKNTAKYTTYKDLELIITCLTKTGSTLERINHNIYEFFPPSSTKKFNISTKKLPSETSKYKISISDIKVASQEDY